MKRGEDVMFCDQWEQTATGGCTVVGVCAKAENTVSLQDTFVFTLKGIAAYRAYEHSFVIQIHLRL